jgi:hypothetical protein
LGLHVKRPPLLSNCNQVWNGSTDVDATPPVPNFMKILLIVPLTVICGQTCMAELVGTSATLANDLKEYNNTIRRLRFVQYGLRTPAYVRVLAALPVRNVGARGTVSALTGDLLDRLCGLVVRVSAYRSRGPGFDSRPLPDFLRSSRGLERGPLSLVRTIDELFE